MALHKVANGSLCCPAVKILVYFCVKFVMRISSVLAHLTKKLIVYNLFLSRRKIIAIDGRIAEQTSRSYAMATIRQDLFYTFSVPDWSGTFRSVVSRWLHVDCCLVRSCVRCRNNVSEISTYWCHELQEGTWIVDRK
jgi:hypothetical protein